MNMSAKSSGFRVQLSASRLFGLIETTSGRHKLTPLGGMILGPQQERGARAQAFMNVPLYKAIYEAHKTGVLPPAAALEREITSLGVAEKQTTRARQVFERSADQAGAASPSLNLLVHFGQQFVAFGQRLGAAHDTLVHGHCRPRNGSLDASMLVHVFPESFE